MDEQLSNEVAFQAAGADAVHKAMRDNIVLLEPVMKLEVTVPEEYLGPVTADLNARRAEIREVHARGKLRVVEALVPLRADVRLLRKVRSLTQGRATPAMEPHSFGRPPTRCCGGSCTRKSSIDAACGVALAPRRRTSCGATARALRRKRRMTP